MSNSEEMYLEFLRKKRQVYQFVQAKVFSTHQAADILELLAEQYGFKLKDSEITMIKRWRKSKLVYEVVRKETVRVYLHDNGEEEVI